ncbi:MAG: class I SAM-dependent methyltransferase [Acidimicrobiales bacterium]
MADRYFIRPDYRHRDEPEYADDVEHDVVWQPDVYTEAARLAEALDASCIVDIGCGNGRKLAALHPRFEVVGIDLPGPNLERARALLPDVDWLEHDVESDQPLPVPDAVLSRSVVVCSDVIEHLRQPERLLVKLVSALPVARAVVLSTPDRVVTWGPDHVGPPPNPRHVREWTTGELDALLDDAGFAHRLTTFTRSNDQQTEKKTILCRLFADPEAMRLASLLDSTTAAGRPHPGADPTPGGTPAG